MRFDLKAIRVTPRDRHNNHHGHIAICEDVERSRARMTDVVPANTWESDVMTAVKHAGC
jgi:hypothetical protein